MNPTYDFNGKVALVTGASKGMGLATARASAETGAAVTLSDRDEPTLFAEVDKLKSAGHKVIGVVCDVSDEAQVASMVERTVAEFGRLDMAYNNAGILGPMGDVTDETAEAFDEVTAVNLRGVWACMKHELLQMRKQGNGAIVNCSSIGGLIGLAGRAAYHAGKHGVIGLTRSAAMDYADEGHPRERDLSRLHRHADGRRHRSGGNGGVPEGAAHRARGAAGRGCGRGALALQSRRQPRSRRRIAGRRRLHRPLSPQERYRCRLTEAAPAERLPFASSSATKRPKSNHAATAGAADAISRIGRAWSLRKRRSALPAASSVSSSAARSAGIIMPDRVSISAQKLLACS